MRYKDVKRAVLGHIDQYTMAGALVPEGYNDQADYLAQIPVLINEALVNIRTQTKPLRVSYHLTDGHEENGFVEYEFPADFWSLCSGGVSLAENGTLRKTNDYRLVGSKTILIPAKHAGKVYIEYNRYPNLLPLNDSLTDDFDLAEDIDVIQAATYFASAGLIVREDEFMYASLYNEYETRRQHLTNGVTAEVHTVDDAYAHPLFEGGWV